MKTATKPKTVQQWIRLRKIELRRIEKQGSKSKTPQPPPRLFLVPERGRVAQQMEFQFEETSEIERVISAVLEKTQNGRKPKVG